MKKIKLFLSLCMMCLCIAVLCMGILAAGSATYNINGNISYNMLDYVASINTRVYKVEGQTDITGLTSGVNTLSTMTFEQIERTIITETDASDKYYILTEKLSAQTTTADGGEFSGNVNIEYGATDSSVEYYTFYVVMSIKETTGDYKLTATLKNSSGTEISGTLSDDNSKSYIYTNGSQSNVLKTDTKNIVIGFSLKTSSMTESFTTDSFTYALTVTCGPIDFYLELGQVSSTDTTKIKWKLVYLDNISWNALSDNWSTMETSQKEKYLNLTIDKLKGRGAIFVQETQMTDSTFICYGSENDYFTGSVRTKLLDGTIFNLNDTEKSYLNNGYITARKFETEASACADGDGDYGPEGYFIYPWRSFTCTDSGGNYFWLMSVGEVCEYFDDPLELGNTEKEDTVHEKIRWGESHSGNDFLLRTQCYSTLSLCYCLTMVYDEGRFVKAGVMTECDATNIRAAFQLA